MLAGLGPVAPLVASDDREARREHRPGRRRVRDRLLRLRQPPPQAVDSARVSDEHEWLSTAQAAARIGVVTRTLYRMIDQGELPAYRIGRVLRLKAADIDRFIEACRVEPGTLAHLHPSPPPPR